MRQAVLTFPEPPPVPTRVGRKKMLDERRLLLMTRGYYGYLGFAAKPVGFEKLLAVYLGEPVPGKAADHEQSHTDGNGSPHGHAKVRRWLFKR